MARVGRQLAALKAEATVRVNRMDSPFARFNYLFLI